MPLRRMRHSERTAACLAHMAGVVPIWGALVMATILWRFRGRSRPVVFHAMQALFFHFAVLFVATVPLLAVGIGKLAAVLRPDLGDMTQAMGWIGFYVVLAVNAAIALIAANTVIEARDFNYPFFGRRLRPTFEEPPVIRRRRTFHTYTTPIPQAEFVSPVESIDATAGAPTGADKSAAGDTPKPAADARKAAEAAKSAAG